jgi:hypothetical protein
MSLEVGLNPESSAVPVISLLTDREPALEGLFLAGATVLQGMVECDNERDALA